MRMCILSVPLIMFLSRATAVEHANAPQRAPHAAAVAYVLAKVECDNPEEVAALLFADTTEDLFAEQHWEKEFHFETEPLGDGTECYVFSPPWGSGQWGFRPNYHYVKHGSRLQMIFDSEGTASRYCTDGSKYNGRYTLQRWWRADTFGGIADRSVTLAWAYALYFWDGAIYRHAYTVTDIEESADPDKIGVTLTWNATAREAFLSAHVTWERKVRDGDTLSAICKQYKTPLHDVVLQNGINDPDQIVVDQVLRYDSKKTK